MQFGEHNMTYEQFVNLTNTVPYVGFGAMKDENNFVFTSNHALFSMGAAETPEQALSMLKSEARSLEAQGYSVKWEIEETVDTAN